MHMCFSHFAVSLYRDPSWITLSERACVCGCGCVRVVLCLHVGVRARARVSVRVCMCIVSGFAHVRVPTCARAHVLLPLSHTLRDITTCPNLSQTASSSAVKRYGGKNGNQPLQNRAVTAWVFTWVLTQQYEHVGRPCEFPLPQAIRDPAGIVDIGREHPV
jgi:hypothetical protein